LPPHAEGMPFLVQANFRGFRIISNLGLTCADEQRNRANKDLSDLDKEFQLVQRST